jgi:hypothetical protein
MNAKHTAVILSQAARGKQQHGDEEEGGSIRFSAWRNNRRQ